MDYKIGSLAELISGKKANNKLKKVKKEIVLPKPEPEVTATDSNKSRRKPKINKFIKLEKKGDFTEDLTSINQLKKEKLGKKRKFEDVDPKLKRNGAEVCLKKPKLSIKKKKANKVIKKGLNEADTNSPEDTSNVTRTVFVGNVAINTDKKKLQKHFRKYGEIEAVRIRGIPVADPKISKKVAFIKKQFHPDRATVYAFIRFKNESDAKKAEVENGTVFEGLHLRVHCCSEKLEHDESKAIYVGNISFDAKDDDLRTLFQECGPISHVRVIRDRETGMGKGFGYVNFKDADSVQLAFEMGTVIYQGRELRISPCDIKMAKSKKANGVPYKTKFKSKIRHKFKNQRDENEAKDKIKLKLNSIKKGKDESVENQQNKVKKVATSTTQFGGTKFTDKGKKKKKVNKGLLVKKKIAKKLTTKKES